MWNEGQPFLYNSLKQKLKTIWKFSSDYLKRGITLCGIDVAVVQIPDGMHGIEKVDIDCHVVTTRDEKSPARSSENQTRKSLGTENRHSLTVQGRNHPLVQMHIYDSNI